MPTITNTYTTAGSWSSTAPAGTISATYVINGAGGGAIGFGVGKAGFTSAGGGGAETRSGSIASLTGGTILSGTIGAGGANSAVSTANATAGGSTTLLVGATSTATAHGGGGASAANTVATIAGTGGSGGSGGSGTNGEAGGVGAQLNGGACLGTNGGARQTANGTVGNSPGGGGAGGAIVHQVNGAGAPGQVQIVYTIVATVTGTISGKTLVPKTVTFSGKVGERANAVAKTLSPKSTFNAKLGEKGPISAKTLAPTSTFNAKLGEKGPISAKTLVPKSNIVVREGARASISSTTLAPVSNIQLRSYDGLTLTAKTLTPIANVATHVVSYIGSVTATTLIPSNTATNLSLNSPRFSAWGPFGIVTQTANAAVAPDSSTTATLFVPSTSNSNHGLSYGSGMGSGTFTFSIYAKTAGYPRIALRVYDGSVYQMYTTFDISVGNIVVSTAGTPSIYPVGNGWFRCVVTGTTLTGSLGNISGWCVDIEDATHTTQQPFTGDGVSGVYLWGGQIQTGYIPTTYIPTGASTVTAPVGMDYGYVGASSSVSVKTLIPKSSMTGQYATGLAIVGKTLTPNANFIEKEGASASITAKTPLPYVPNSTTNILRWSQDYTNAVWTKSGATITANAAIAPDGTLTATQVAVTASQFGLYQSVTTPIVTGTYYTISVWLRAASNTNIIIGLNGLGNTLNNVGLFVSVTTSWKRFSLTIPTSSDTGLYAAIAATNWSTTPGQTGAAATVFAWGAQLEASRFASNYLLTTANATTGSVGIAGGEVGVTTIVGGKTLSPFSSINIKEGAVGTISSKAPSPTASITFSSSRSLVINAKTVPPVSNIVAKSGATTTIHPNTIPPFASLLLKEGSHGTISSKTLIPSASFVTKEGAHATVAKTTLLPTVTFVAHEGESAAINVKTLVPTSAFVLKHARGASINAKTLIPVGLVNAKEGVHVTISATTLKPSSVFIGKEGSRGTIAKTTLPPIGLLSTKIGNTLLVSTVTPVPNAGNATNLWINSRVAAGFSFPRGVAIYDNAGIAPDGTGSAIRINGTGATWVAAQNIVGTPSGTGTISMWVKSNTGSTQQFRLYGSGAIVSANMNATTTWQRFSWTTSYGSSEWGIARDAANDPGDYLVWGPQFELGSVMHNYVPTGANTVVSGFAYGAVGETLTVSSNTLVPKALFNELEGENAIISAVTPLPNIVNTTTNLLLWSQNITNAHYPSGASYTGTANYALAPDGSFTASRVQLAGTAPSCGPQQQPTIINLATYTISAWVKSNTGTNQTFAFKLTQASIADHMSPNLTATTSWRRLSFTQTMGTGSTGSFFGITADSAGSASDILVWGMQAELGSLVNNYVPTTTSQVTAPVGIASGDIGPTTQLNATTVSPNGNFALLGNNLLVLNVTTPTPKANIIIGEIVKDAINGLTLSPKATIVGKVTYVVKFTPKTLNPTASLNAKLSLNVRINSITTRPSSLFMLAHGVASVNQGDVIATTNLPKSIITGKYGPRMGISVKTLSPDAHFTLYNVDVGQVSVLTLKPSTTFIGKEGVSANEHAVTPLPKAQVNVRYTYIAQIVGKTISPTALISGKLTRLAQVATKTVSPKSTFNLNRGENGSINSKTLMPKFDSVITLGASQVIKFVPVWLTPAGNIANTVQGSSVSVTLNAVEESIFMASDGEIIINVGEPASRIISVKINSQTTTSYRLIGNSVAFNNALSSTDIVDIITNDQLQYSLLYGTMPPGLSLSSTGIISGTVGTIPTTNGNVPSSYSFAVRASDGVSVRDRQFMMTATPAIVDSATPGWGNLPTRAVQSATPADFSYVPLGDVVLGNVFLYQIDIFDPGLPPILEVQAFTGATSITSPYNNIPLGLSLSNSGVISGTISPSQPLGQYFFNIKMLDNSGNAITTGTGATPITAMIEIDAPNSTLPSLKVITWTTPAGILASMKEGQSSPYSVSAFCSTGEAVSYTLSQNTSLPPGLTLDASTGQIQGSVGYVSSNQTFTFTVQASVGQTYVYRTFSIVVVSRYNTPDYVDLTFCLHAVDTIPMVSYYNNVISSSQYFRLNDENYENITNPTNPGNNNTKILLAGGLNGTVNDFENAVRASNFDAPVNLILGAHKIAYGRINGQVVYEVLYREVIDPLADAGGYIIQNGIPEANPVLYPESSTGNPQYIYPPSINNIRCEFISTMGFPTIDSTISNNLSLSSGAENLPLWMTCPQVGNNVTTALGYTPAVVLAYLKPGQGQVVLGNITNNPPTTSSINLNPVAEGHQVEFDQYFVAFEQTSQATTFDINTTTFDSNTIVWDTMLFSGGEFFRMNRSTYN